MLTDFASICDKKRPGDLIASSPSAIPLHRQVGSRCQAFPQPTWLGILLSGFEGVT